MPNQNKWPGPIDENVSVGDELAYDALPEETRRLAERVLGMRISRGDEAYSEGYDDGKERGQALAKEQWAKEQNDYEERLLAGLREVKRLGDVVADRDQQLKLAGQQINQLNADLRRLRKRAS